LFGTQGQQQELLRQLFSCLGNLQTSNGRFQGLKQTNKQKISKSTARYVLKMVWKNQVFAKKKQLTWK